MSEDHWKSIFGWFDYEELYDTAVERLKDGDTIVELGTFLGKSTCYLAQRIKESNKKIMYYACDIFKAPEVAHIPKEFWGDFYNVFKENLRQQGVEEFVIPICMNSLDFLNFFDDDNISFIYIDDNHNVDHVYQELNLWYPKLTEDGVMAGHDYNAVKEAVIRYCEENDMTYFRTGGSWTLARKENDRA